MPQRSPEFKTHIDYPLMMVPLKIADAMLGGRNKLRIVLHFDNGIHLHRALQRNKNGECFIIMGKSSIKEVKKCIGEEVKIFMLEDTSKYGMPVPEELEEVFRQDEEGRQYFEALTPGIQRSILYYINTAKTIDTRINRSLKFIEDLRSGRFLPEKKI